MHCTRSHGRHSDSSRRSLCIGKSIGKSNIKAFVEKKKLLFLNRNVNLKNSIVSRRQRRFERRRKSRSWTRRERCIIRFSLASVEWSKFIKDFNRIKFSLQKKKIFVESLSDSAVRVPLDSERKPNVNTNSRFANCSETPTTIMQSCFPESGGKNKMDLFHPPHPKWIKISEIAAKKRNSRRRQSIAFALQARHEGKHSEQCEIECHPK